MLLLSKNVRRISLILIGAFLLAHFPAFGQQSVRRRQSLPRVGVIGKYEFPSAFAEGCANRWIRSAKSAADIFLSTGDGTDAWMNLNNRVRQLRLLKLTLRYKTRNGEPSTIHEYRFGKTRISVRLWKLNENAPTYQAKITLQNGRAKRTIYGEMQPQCD
jgi:hypothetical protein